MAAQAGLFSHADLDLKQLPDILAELESDSPASLAKGSLALARLVDEATGYQASVLGEYMRDCGALELMTGASACPRPRYAGAP